MLKNKRLLPARIFSIPLELGRMPIPRCLTPLVIREEKRRGEERRGEERRGEKRREEKRREANRL